MLFLNKSHSEKKLNKKVMAISSLVFIFILLFLVPNEYSAGIKEMIAGAVAFLIRFIADGIAWVLGPEGMNVGIDKLIFNIDGSFDKPTILTDFNLTLLRDSGTVSTSLFKLYYLFMFIAVSLLGVIGTLIILDFIKTAEDPKHKAVLKGRIIKLFVSIILILSIPQLLDLLLTINQVLLDVIRLFIADNVKNIDFSNAFLTDVFRGISEANEDNIILAAIYLMSTCLNVWLVAFYMLRDLGIAYLMLIGPIIALFTPYNTPMVLTWAREFISNVVTQSIQAIILAVVLIITAAVGTESTLYEQIFALVAFASFIPTTAKLKRLLNLEGDIGAAKSNAGLGAVIGAMGVTGLMAAGISKSANTIKGSFNDIGNIKAEERLMNKSSVGETVNSVGNRMPSGLNTSSSYNSSIPGNSLGSSGAGGFNPGGGFNPSGGFGPSGGLNPNGGVGPGGAYYGGRVGVDFGGRGIEVDPNNISSTNRSFRVDPRGEHGDTGGYTATSRARELQGMKANARKDIAKAIGGGIFGVVGGGIMAAGTSVYGNPMATMIATKAGIATGSKIGAMGAGTGFNMGTYGSEVVQDRMYGEGIRYDGEQNQKLGSVFEGTKATFTPKGIKENFNIVKSNYNRNRDIINMNKENIEQAQIRATGLDPSKMSPEDFEQEKNAILHRNRYERRGLYEQAHRTYAKETYDRNKKDIGLEIGNGNVQRLESAKLDRPKIDENSVVKPRTNDEKNIDILDSSLNQHVDEFLNNNEYLLALNEMINSSPELFSNNINSGLN